MFKFNNKKAFTIFELAVVLVIVIVIFFGFFKAQTISYTSNLAKARSLTINSPVAAINGLELWLETTLPDSFDKDEAIDNSTINNWYDLNTQNIAKNNATSSGDPIYIKNAVNNLPAIEFDGTSDYFDIGGFNHDPSQGFFIFAVIDIDSDVSGTENILSQQDGNGTGRSIFQIRNNSGIIIGSYLSGSATLGGAVSFEPEIYAAGYDFRGVTPADLNLYVNGQVTTSSITADSADGDWRIGVHKSGSSNFLGGFIAEIIVYNRHLSDEERQDIEDYLSQKWDIDLN